jgi:hypothetical protein
MLQKLKIISVGIGLIFFLLSLLSVLQYFRFQHLLFEVARSRVEVPAEALKRDIERSLATGLSVQTNSQLPTMLNLVLQKNPIIFSIQIKDTLSDSSEPLWFAGKLPTAHKDRDGSILANEPVQKTIDSNDAAVFTQRWPIVDPIGTTVAHLIFISDKSEALNLAAKARNELLPLLGVLCASSLAILVPILLFLLIHLDKVVTAARALILGKPIDQSSLAHSEVCKLAQNVQEAKNLPLPHHASST